MRTIAPVWSVVIGVSAVVLGVTLGGETVTEVLSTRLVVGFLSLTVLHLLSVAYFDYGNVWAAVASIFDAAGLWFLLLYGPVGAIQQPVPIVELFSRLVPYTVLFSVVGFAVTSSVGVTYHDSWTPPSRPVSPADHWKPILLYNCCLLVAVVGYALPGRIVVWMAAFVPLLAVVRNRETYSALVFVPITVLGVLLRGDLSQVFRIFTISTAILTSTIFFSNRRSSVGFVSVSTALAIALLVTYDTGLAASGLSQLTLNLLIYGTLISTIAGLTSEAYEGWPSIRYLQSKTPRAMIFF